MGEVVAVEMRCVGPDSYEGMLDEVLVQARLGEACARLTLWMPLGWGKNPCGHGLLEQVSGGDVVLWEGDAVDEVGRRAWTVTGVLGHDKLLFVPKRGK